jgi:hypothetical protein
MSGIAGWKFLWPHRFPADGFMKKELHISQEWL